MAKRKSIEDRMLDQINLNEGLLGTLFKTIVKQKLKRTVLRKLKDDPELMSMLTDLENQRKRVEDKVDNYCKHFPNSKHCDSKGRFKR